MTRPRSSWDTLLMTTDGVTEARRGREFPGTEGLQRLGGEVLPLGTLELSGQAILMGAQAFEGGSFGDDVCIVLARRR